MHMLPALSDYLQRYGRASLSDLARTLGSTPEAVEPMLEHLARKGRIRRLPEGSSCGKPCCACDPATQIIYEWAQ